MHVRNPPGWFALAGRYGSANKTQESTGMYPDKGNKLRLASVGVNLRSGQSQGSRLNASICNANEQPYWLIIWITVSQIPITLNRDIKTETTSLNLNIFEALPHTMAQGKLYAVLGIPSRGQAVVATRRSSREHISSLSIYWLINADWYNLHAAVWFLALVGWLFFVVYFLKMSTTPCVRLSSPVLYPPEAGVYIFCCWHILLLCWIRFSPLIKTEISFSAMPWTWNRESEEINLASGNSWSQWK